MTVIVRFAPSPTGNIHIGNARTALINWLFAKSAWGRAGGQFVLRYDDTDRERSKQEFADGIARDLAWLGIKPDRVEKQSAREAVHAAATEKLKAAGVLYPCYETPDEIERKRKRQAMRNLPPVYDRAALKLTAAQRAELEAAGKKPHWRFLLPNHAGDPSAPVRTEVHWDDVIRGPQTVDLASMSDPVLVREDGTWPYTLPSVDDDIDIGITHVIRGDDHVANTGVQIAIFKALGAEPPMFGHHNLLTTASGEGLSKRLGSLSLKSLAEEGYEPMAIASLAVLIGGAGAVDAVASLDELAGRLDLKGISKSAAKFDVSELLALNARLVHAMDWPQAQVRLGGALGPNGEAIWLAVRANCEKVRDAVAWRQKIEGNEALAETGEADREYLTTALSLLPSGEADATTWHAWTGAIKAATGRKGRDLFMPLRKALTGAEHGPDMAALLPLIGRERIAARLS